MFCTRANLELCHPRMGIYTYLPVSPQDGSLPELVYIHTYLCHPRMGLSQNWYIYILTCVTPRMGLSQNWYIYILTCVTLRMGLSQNGCTRSPVSLPEWVYKGNNTCLYVTHNEIVWLSEMYLRNQWPSPPWVNQVCELADYLTMNSQL